MATLQKIRNRGGILVSVVIGLALVAFIVGDALSSGASIMNKSRNKVGEVGGETISIQEYQQKITKNEEMVKSMNRLSALSEDQQRMVRENTWQQIVSNIIMEKEYKDLGLGLSGDELYDLLLGENMNPAIKQLFADPQTGQVDKDQARLIIKQLIEAPAGTPQKEYWLNMEEQISTARKQNKYNILLTKGLFIPDAMAQEILENSATTVDLSYIMKSYNSISDSSINVSANEIKEYYNSHQNLFEQGESRQIVYVNFDIAASPKDIKETEEWASSLKEEFANAANVIEFANLSSEKKFPAAYVKKGDLGYTELDEFIFDQKGNGVYGPYLKDQAYNIARVAERRMLPDSVKARHILIIPQNGNNVQAEKLADSLAGALRKGADFETIARQYSADQNSAVNGGDLGWFTQNDMIQPFSDTAFFAKKNDIKLVKTQYGYHIVEVTERSTPVEKALVGIIAKEITPSQETINQIYNDARVFVNNVTTLADFEKAVTEQNQTKRIANLNKNDKTMPGLDNARELIRQAYLTDKTGNVLITREKSPIFESGNKFTVAVLTDIKEEGVAPLNSVAEIIKRELIRKKKGDIIAKELQQDMSGSQSLLSIAQKAKLEVVDANDVSFNSFQLPGAGIEPKVIAEAVSMKEGEISKPIIGNQGVYVLMVNTKNVNTITPEQIAQAKESLFQTNFYRVNQLLLPSLVKKAGIVDTRYKFY